MTISFTLRAGTQGKAPHNDCGTLFHVYTFCSFGKLQKHGSVKLHVIHEVHSCKRLVLQRWKEHKEMVTKRKVLRKQNMVIALLFNVPCVLRNERITYVPKRIQLE
jgi:hypothetical protein